MICIGKTKCTSEKGLLATLPPKFGGSGQVVYNKSFYIPMRNRRSILINVYSMSGNRVRCSYCKEKDQLKLMVQPPSF